MIYKKRGGWFYRDIHGQLHKFKTEADAAAAAGTPLDIPRFKLPERGLLSGVKKQEDINPMQEAPLIGEDD
jgi:hypothetical protein